MLSYRHGFHAGNHADIIKHLTLCLLIRSLNQKDKPYCLIDTHSGGGVYSQDSTFAQKNAEFRTGLNRILDDARLKTLVPEYFRSLEALRKDGAHLIPGSPYLEQRLLRENDRLVLNDLHPSEQQSLHRLFGRDQRVTIQNRDGYEALGGLLPPTPRRGLCFIDPSYEEKNEYHELVKGIKKGIARWATGIYAVWYPVLGRLIDHSKELTQDLRRLGLPMLQAELRVMPQQEERGMCGSGMLILNYPFGLDRELEDLMGPLYKALCDEGGEARLRVLNPRQ